MATIKFLQYIQGFFSETRTVDVSTGAPDASKIPSTNANGVLDPSLLNATITSSGAPSANKIPQLGPNGQLDPTMMPTGIVADVKIITASEALAAGAFINTYILSGNLRMRNADAATGRPAHGYVESAVASGANGTAYFEGTNHSASGRTIGAAQWLGAAGLATETPPVAPGIGQQIGTALSPTEVSFTRGPVVNLTA